MGVIDHIPEGYIPLPDYCRSRGINPHSAAQAAKMGNIPGAVRVLLPGYSRPMWWVPSTCDWRPNPRGKRYDH